MNLTPVERILADAMQRVDAGDIEDMMIVGVAEDGARVVLYAVGDIPRMDDALDWASDELTAEAAPRGRLN